MLLKLTKQSVFRLLSKLVSPTEVFRQLSWVISFMDFYFTSPAKMSLKAVTYCVGEIATSMHRISAFFYQPCSPRSPVKKLGGFTLLSFSLSYLSPIALLYCLISIFCFSFQCFFILFTTLSQPLGISFSKDAPLAEERRLLLEDALMSGLKVYWAYSFYLCCSIWSLTHFMRWESIGL